MQVEIYDNRESNISESGEILTEDDRKCLELMEKLNLSEQIKFNTYGRNPYDIVSLKQRIVVANLFPRHCLMNEYAGFIPERVLYELETADKQFEKIYIAFAPPTTIVDPIVIGTNKEWHDFSAISSVHPMPVKSFLIARWGDALDSWDSLYNKSVEVKTKEVVDALDKVQSELYLAYSKINSGIELPSDSLLDGMPTSIRIPFN